MPVDDERVPNRLRSSSLSSGLTLHPRCDDRPPIRLQLSRLRSKSTFTIVRPPRNDKKYDEKSSLEISNPKPIITTVPLSNPSLLISLPLLTWPRLLIPNIFSLEQHISALRTQAILRILELRDPVRLRRAVADVAVTGVDAGIKLVIKKFIALSAAMAIEYIVDRYDDPSVYPGVAQAIEVFEGRRVARQVSGWVGQCAADPFAFKLEKKLVCWWSDQRIPNAVPTQSQTVPPSLNLDPLHGDDSTIPTISCTAGLSPRPTPLVS